MKCAIFIFFYFIWFADELAYSAADSVSAGVCAWMGVRTKEHDVREFILNVATRQLAHIQQPPKRIRFIFIDRQIIHGIAHLNHRTTQFYSHLFNFIEGFLPTTPPPPPLNE